ncbi:tol-pal system protein YbgF [Desulfovibrio sp. OttesenSCG-928-G11]|nr:tol-pal system protein YbgF [Desulfovibrio sp. OttesenSCG-928-G11]
MNAPFAKPPFSPLQSPASAGPAPALSKRLAAILLVCLPLCLAGCATAGEKVAELAEVQERDRKVTDLRLTRVEERVDGVENGLNQVRGSLAGAESSRTTKQSPRQARSRSAESQAASPVVIGTKSLNDIPQVSPIPYLPQNVRELSGAAGAQNPYSGPASPAPALAATLSPNPGPAAPPAKANPANMATLAPAPSAGADSAPGLRPASLTSAMPPRAAASGGGKGGSRATGSAAYDQALALYYKGDYDKARQAFAAFIQASPSSSLAANALYWQGECSYSQGKYDEAIIVFKDVAAKHPRHDKAPASLLKAGYAYERMKDMENARFYWQLLLDDYPSSSPAALARKKMTGPA